MASHRENSQVHQESAPRAPVVPQHATGMRNNNGNEQRQIGLTSGAQFGVQARTAGTDPGVAVREAGGKTINIVYKFK